MAPDPVVEPSILKSVPSPALLDVRSADAFSAGHPVNATRVPVERWEAAAKADETSFDNVEYWDRAIGELGIADGNARAVVYDDGRMTDAARVWFILQHFGVSASILNGAWPAIDRRAYRLGVTRSHGAAPSFRGRAGSGSVGLVDRLELKTGLGQASRVLDARSRAEFDGEDLRANPRGGHLPGARWLAHDALLDRSWVRPAAELRVLFEAAGFQDGDHVVTHCDGGGRAALAAAAAVRAGYRDVRVYYLSFADWARDDSCPIVRT